MGGICSTHGADEKSIRVENVDRNFQEKKSHEHIRY